MCCNDVVGLFFLTELVTIVLRLVFSSLTNERRRNQRTVHRREQGPTKDTCDSKHVEGVHEDVVLCLEDQHVVERTRDAERHSVRERTLTEWIDQEYCRCSGDRRRVSNTDPWAHTQAIRQFPLTTHVAVDADEEVEDYELERTTVVEAHSSRDALPRWDRSEVRLRWNEGTTAPEMMLLPYMSEPATGSRIPSMSTGGAAMNATMKQMVAANRVGIISTPNQPTYRRLLVEVTQSQNDSQVDCPCCWKE